MTLPTHLIERPNMKAVHYLQSILNDDMWLECYSKDEDIDNNMSLARTQKYIKALLKSGGKFKATYKKSIYDKKGICRSYGDGIQGIPSAIRGLLCDGIMTDIDVVNCFPSILVNICDKHDIPCPNLQHYIQHRKKLIDEGKVRNKIDVMISINTSEAMKTSSGFMISLDAEIKAIQKILIIKDFYAIKENMNPKAKNFNGTFMTNLLMFFEAKILNSAFKYLTEKKIEVGAFMFDGLMVYGDFHNCDDLSQYVYKDTGLEISFITKPHSQQMKIPDDFSFDSAGEKYSNTKKQYEEGYKLAFIVDIVAYSYCINGKYYFYNKEQIKQILNTVKIGDKKFIDLWLEDEERKTFHKVDIIPFDSPCPDDVLNLWTGYEVENIKGEIVDVEPILKHIRIQMGNDDECYEFMMNWLANMFQYPSSRSPLVSISTESGGTGKGLLIELIKNMIGDDKFYMCDDVKGKLFGDFNGHMRGISLCNIDEPSAKDLNPYYDRLKTMIDSPTISIHDKGQKILKVNNFTKYIGTSNNLQAFKIKKGDRRIFSVEGSDELKGNTDYFIQFSDVINNKDYQYSFYKLLMSRQVKKKLTDKDFPITSLMKDAIVLSQDPVEDFIIEMNEGEFTGDELYIAYKQFMDKSGLEFKDNKKQFEMKFGRLMEKYQVTQKRIDRKETDDNGNTIRARFRVYVKK